MHELGFLYTFAALNRIIDTFKPLPMKSKFLLSICLAALTLPAMALELPEQIGDNMMLQQQTQARLWGWAKGGSSVTVTPSWNGQKYSVKANKADGRWEVLVETPAASYTNHSISIQGDGETRHINNVLIGEVWFCSGQSNMEMPLRGFWNCPIEGSNETIAMSGKHRASIRVATIAKVAAQEPMDRVAGRWKECTPENAPEFSAVGYYFARTLTDMIDVPVGIINCSWGGSCVEGWLPKDTLLTYPDGLTPFGPHDYLQKMVMFNGMLNPLAGYTIRGFLWNQGESNIGREKEYYSRFQTMTRLWRKMWRQGNDPLPIYTVELPPYWYDNVEGTNGADFRQVQHLIARQLENSGCVCTSDLIYDYEPKQIHGTKKLEIGQRLAYMAATRDYGMKGIAAEAPEFQKMILKEANEGDQRVIAGSAVEQNPNEKGKVLVLYFSHMEDGVDRLYDIEGFEAAGADGIWHPATVWADSDWRDPAYQGCFLKLVCPAAGEIKNIRYNYHNFVVGHLHNARQLPVVPFSTDYNLNL